MSIHTPVCQFVMRVSAIFFVSLKVIELGRSLDEKLSHYFAITEAF